jgi:hypothetical protein
VSVDLVDPAPRSPLRGTRSSGYQTISASTYRQNDPPTPQTRLPSRTTKSATRQLGRKVIFDPARRTTKKAPDFRPGPGSVSALLKDDFSSDLDLASTGSAVRARDG